MGGTLKYGKSFEKRYYTGADGKQHYELLVKADGDSDNVSHSTWREMKELAEVHGMPKEVWPEFMDHDFGIDIPLDEVEARQANFRSYLLAIPEAVYQTDAPHHRRMRQLAGLARGEYLVFFCGN